MEKNKLSFKLDEPVTTALNVNPLTDVNKEDSLSFVVLGQDSLEAQASLLASYTDLQQKSMLIDYESIVSSMTTTEIQHKLIEVWQENVKLNETLRKNNISMKQQFDTLTELMKESKKVRQVHKQKFAETLNSMNHLQKENTELKSNFWSFEYLQDIQYEIVKVFSDDTIVVPSKPEKLDANEICEFAAIISKIADKRLKKFIKFVLSKKFDIKEELQNLQQLEMEKELQSAMIDDSINYKLYDEEIRENSKCLEVKNQEIVCLKESIPLHEQKLQCVLTPVQQDLLGTSNLNHQKFVENIKQYNDMLQELTKCFIGQVVRFVTIEKDLKEITDILRLDDNSKMQYKEKLCQYYKELTDEQMKIIIDRQTLIKSQNQFQKILSDHNSVLHELQIMLDKNVKLNILEDNSFCKNSQTLEQLEHDKQSLEQEKNIFDQEKNTFDQEKEKKSFEIQKKSLDMERTSLQDERKLLEQEKIALNEKKMSLDHQSQLYKNCESDLHNEKKTKTRLQARIKQLSDKTSSLQQQIEEKEKKFEKMLQLLEQCAEEKIALRSQSLIDKEAFRNLEKMNEALLEEKCKLDKELLKQIDFNKQLQSRYKTPNNSTDMSEQMFKKCLRNYNCTCSRNKMLSKIL
ncbi:PREDICTED: centromere-associated protein E-like [Cyphomyrmex costatus]|uniref:centromere-associated protein E-like n=1 Tax=Cyphomyrmex costatus TaxID=456900 RepID=UPI0008522479|nr:PREDICTED: centromere-associated protein E-like [Cyphomyrmex costatus]